MYRFVIYVVFVFTIHHKKMNSTYIECVRFQKKKKFGKAQHRVCRDDSFLC